MVTIQPEKVSGKSPAKSSCSAVEEEIPCFRDEERRLGTPQNISDPLSVRNQFYVFLMYCHHPDIPKVSEDAWVLVTIA